MLPIGIRKEKGNDIERIHEVIEAAFLYAPHTDHTEHYIVEALRNSGALTISLVAEDAGNIIGHVAVSRVSISDGSEGWFGLGPISVDPTRQGVGIGSKLMAAALDELKNINANGCVLLGDPEFYKRFGFESIESLILPGVPPEYFQVVAFKGSYPRGEVAYHESFASKG